MAKPNPAATYEAEAYSYAEAQALTRELGLSGPVAITLVRRGYRTAEAARAFLDADETHDPFAFDSMGEICERIQAAIHDRRRITVHGDYDADGVCSTSILVRALRDLGAEADWYLPDRADGYGLSIATVERLAVAGTGLLITADCGIGCAAEIARARELGMSAIVTDHHSPLAELPDCPILHPVVSGYPFPELCATGVAYKLSAALRSAAGRHQEEADADLDIVALATVADLVPLRGENRSLVKRGVAELRRARRPGMRALIAVAGIEPTALEAGDLAFKLAPRINAAGRLYRADAGVELMLTEDDARAAQIADELNRANQERRFAEREVQTAAEAARTALPDSLKEASALVLAGEGWHGGVVGIVASRMVEAHGVPTVMIALDGERGRGSGRSVPAFDLLGGLEACSEHLVTFGGHRAAAGLEIEAANVDAFREAFVAHAESVLSPDDLARTQRVDAVVSGGALGHELAEQLEKLGPFGMGNPGVRLLVPSAQVSDVRPMGQDGKHVRFSLSSGAGNAMGVAFGHATLPVADGKAADLSVRLELNHWNGTIEPRVVLQELYPLGEENGAGDGCECRDHVGSGEWWGRVAAQLEGVEDEPANESHLEEREVIEHAPGSAVAVMGELVSSGEGVLAICADASRRRALVEHAARPTRFGAGEPVVACGRCPDDVRERVAAAAESGGLALCDYAALERNSEMTAGFKHVLLVDPPPSEDLECRAASGAGFLHVAWGDADLALDVHEEQWGMRAGIGTIYRALQSAEEEMDLAGLLAGPGKHPRSPELAGRCLRVLAELELVDARLNDHARTARVVSSEKTELERSEAYRAFRTRYEEGKQFLSRPRKPR